MPTKNITNKKFVFNKIREKRTRIVIIKWIINGLIKIKLIIMNRLLYINNISIIRKF
jgi:hypothetical protein